MQPDLPFLGMNYSDIMVTIDITQRQKNEKYLPNKTKLKSKFPMYCVTTSLYSKI